MTTAEEWRTLRRRGFWLEYASMAWMTVEAAAAITAGIVASSIVLVGFGLDSVIEFFAAAIVVWQLRSDSRERETLAVRLIGITFFVLAAYVAAASIRDLLSQTRQEQSVLGLSIAAAAVVVMPSLAWAKHRTGMALGSRSLIADGAATALCLSASGAALAGFGLSVWVGWWWADPAGALVIAALALWAGLQAWKYEADD